MKQALIFIIAILFSCNGQVEKSKTPQNTETNIKCNCCSLFEIKKENDFKLYSKNNVKLELNENVKDKHFQKINRKFYDKYLFDKNIFRDWGNDTNEEFDIKHYFYGSIENDEICELLIYEWLSFNETEEKLFLLLIDKNGELIGKYLVSEISYYPGGHSRKYSIITDNQMIIISIDNGIIDQNENGDKYKYYNDSICLRYGKRSSIYSLISSDTTKTQYWE